MCVFVCVCAYMRACMHVYLCVCWLQIQTLVTNYMNGNVSLTVS